MVVVVVGRSATDKVVGVTYGGVAMTRITDAVESGGGDDGRAALFFLGGSIPTGAQTVVVTRTNDATVLAGQSATVTALTDTACVGAVLLQTTGAVPTEQNVDDGSPGSNSLRYAGGFTGSAGNVPAGANSTQFAGVDLGTAFSIMVRETTAGQGSRPVGFATTSSQYAVIHVAVTEAAGGVGYPKILAY